MPLILVVSVALGAVMITSFQNQAKEHQGSARKFGSVGSREVTYTVAWNEIIKPNPLIGIGPKWFRDPYAPGGEPHNLVLDELTSDGVLGLAAFLFLLWTCLRATGATKSEFGELALYVLVARIVADLFDIFWVAGPNTLPFLVLGLAIGAASLEEEQRAVVTSETAQSVTPVAAA